MRGPRPRKPGLHCRQWTRAGFRPACACVCEGAGTVLLAPHRRRSATSPGYAGPGGAPIPCPAWRVLWNRTCGAACVEDHPVARDRAREPGTTKAPAPHTVVRDGRLIQSGAKGSRTPDLWYAKPALCQLSYGPWIRARARSPHRAYLHQKAAQVTWTEPDTAEPRPWPDAAQSRGSHRGVFSPPTPSCRRRAFRGGTWVCLPSVARRKRHGGVADAALARSSDQLSLAAVASVQRSSSARSAWILR